MSVTGRFAPSPTGPLHLGSLLAALGSYCSAKKAGGRWLVRIDDLDGSRNVSGAAEEILRSLVAHGLFPDAAPIFQSSRQANYQAALDTLITLGHTFVCKCSRKDLFGHKIYPGFCRTLMLSTAGNAIRLHMPGLELSFHDEIQGSQSCSLSEEIGDIILIRRDGYFSYHFACAVDDGQTGITEVVRGADLLAETPAQVAIMQLLGLPAPRYAHLPILRDRSGQKLSKQTFAQPLNNHQAARNICRCLRLLNIPLPHDAESLGVSSLLDFGVRAFEVDKVPPALAPVEPR
ncbi:MAG: tRNA glutamyl-Q(34) synthetase GluQRS [Gammaproteobacteria bacterium]|nr:tRNA glutamyl-Q(34) synthetase GluQRS [Gammaproteobacteria bacterium]